MNLNLKYNTTVSNAYVEIVNYSKKLICALEENPFKGILERREEPSITNGYIVSELINPLLYIRLEVYKDDLMAIHYGYEQSEVYSQFYPITSAFIRSIYKYTAKENTVIDIEDCVRTDWVITNCAELYEYMIENSRIAKSVKL